MLTDAATRIVYATDNSIYQVEPEAVALPASAEEVAALLAANHVRTAPRPVVARGGGTGTNGQSLTDGLVLDTKRSLNRILAIDPEARTAVVEPGVVTAALNAELADHGLFWAPHTSTLNRATVGGMIATDAAGKGSLVHGRAHRHVLAIDVVLDDGTPWRAEPTTVAAAVERAAVDDRIGRLWRDLLALDLKPGADHGLPSLARGFSGYGIDRFLGDDDTVDPIALLCGSEGTLAVTTAATLRLTPRPDHTVLVVAGYPSFDEALLDAVDLAATAPTAIESFDETTLERGRSSPAWPALAPVVGDETGSVLLLEYSGPERPDVGPVLAALGATGRSRSARVVEDPAEMAAAWKVRADAVGLLAKVATGGPERSARPTAFVEDCAVPVERMPAFIAGFRRILDDHGLTYGMFGHADVGCVHVRPALDLTDPAHENLVRRITDEVTALVAEHGGLLWGEHGRGFRGDVVDTFLRPDTIDLMRAVKAAFDPRDLLNPGKLYRPTGATEALTPLDGPPLRGAANRRIPLTVRTDYAAAFACNGNGLCLQWDERQAMCPSFLATGDPALSPRGRADLLRAWLARRAGDAALDDGLDDAVAANLDRCLSCSACAGQCPVEVDIGELKSRFLEDYHRTRRRPLSHLVLSRFERMAPLAARAPQALARPMGRLGGRALGLVDLPVPDRPTRPLAGGAPRFRPGPQRSGRPDVVIVPEVFTHTLEPRTLTAAVHALELVGHTVAVAELVPTGKFDHVKGRRAAFARAAEAQRRLIDAVVDADAVPVVIEPAVALLHHHEYPTVDERHSTAVRNLAEVLDARRHRLPAAASPRPVALLGHCTERALAPTWAAAWERVLTAVGHTVTRPDLGCCGMAGIFGHERANQELSRRLFDQGWSRQTAGEGTPVATGYSCRAQIKRFGSAPAEHPVHLLVTQET
ncbi:MAG: FAD-binding and (Fe-S)-binding domain-containing protein [Actinomycetota bacterium]